jgi:hypothetical protein
MVSVWMNEPATDVSPWATMSTSQKPGGGFFQSLNVRIGTSRRIAEENPARRRLPPLAATFTSPSRRRDVAAHLAENHVLRSTRELRLHYIQSGWRDEAAFDTHAGLAHTVRFLNPMGGLMKSWRQARPHWDFAAELLLKAAQTREESISRWRRRKGARVAR